MATVVVALLTCVAPSAAHGGGAVFEVLEAAEAGGLVTLRVRVTHEADGDPARGAMVEVVARGPGGDLPPGRLAREGDEGVYAGTLAIDEPGEWVLELSSSFPEGSTEVPVTVTGAAAGDEPLDEPEVGGAEGGTDRTNLIVAAVSGVLGGALGLWASKRRRARKQAEAAPPEDG